MSSKNNKGASESRQDAYALVDKARKTLDHNSAVGRAALVVAALVAVLSVGMAVFFVQEQSSQVYVVRQSTVQEADAASASSVIDRMVYYHVVRFHEKFYNLAPNMETIDGNINEALGMADESVLIMDNRRKEQQFYSRLVENSIVEEIHMDSLKVNIDTTPYTAHYYGHLYLIRSKAITEYNFESECRLIDVPRSPTNMAGLRIENFRETLREVSREGRRK